MKAVVVGIANHQTSVPVEGFPLAYEATRYLPGQIHAHVGGIGFNVARMLSALGDEVSLAAPLGEDAAAATIDAQAFRYGLSTSLCSRSLTRTPRAVVLHDGAHRAIFTDLGDALQASFDLEDLVEPVREADAVVLGNLDLARPLIAVAKEAGTPLAVDLQDVRGPDNPYDADFLAADILSMSHEHVTGSEVELLTELRERSAARVIVVTLADEGALVSTPALSKPVHVPAVDVGPVADTAGAGDAFFAALVHQLVAGGLDPVAAVRAACADAAWVITHPEQFGVHDSHP